jgi:adenine-specific DNA-methyltransferase
MTKEDQKRNEIFWNEILAPDEISRLLDSKVFTNAKRIDKNGEYPLCHSHESGNPFRTDDNGNIKDNLTIKGNNLLALHSLKKRFAGKIKLIYIDPPFNTEGDSFTYNDRFSHSTWLTFMRNRLEVARDILSQDGTIYVHIDHNEASYLKVLLDEVFGRENFLNEIIWAYKERETSTRFYNRKHDTILFYAKDASSNYIFNYDDVREEYSDVTRSKFKYSDEDGSRYRLRTKDGRSDPAEESENTYRQYLDEKSGPLPRDWFVMPFVNQAAKERVFETQKPEALLRRFIAASTNRGDIVLDFFAGSGTTGAVAKKMGRQYILVEQIESQVKIMTERLKKVIDGEQGGISKSVGWKGGGNFVYLELMKWNEHFVEKIQKAKTKEELKKLWETMKKKAFLSYKVDVKAVDENAKGFADLSIEDQKRFLLECLDKNHLYVNYSEIEDEEYGVSEEDKKVNREFYKD